MKPSVEGLESGKENRNSILHFILQVLVDFCLLISQTHEEKFARLAKNENFQKL